MSAGSFGGGFQTGTAIITSPAICGESLGLALGAGTFAVPEEAGVATAFAGAGGGDDPTGFGDSCAAPPGAVKARIRTKQPPPRWVCGIIDGLDGRF